MFSYSSPFLTWTSTVLVKVFQTDKSQNNFKDFFFWKDDMICMHVKKIRRLKTAWSKHGSYMSLIQLYYSHEFIFDLLIHVVNYGWLINHLREKNAPSYLLLNQIHLLLNFLSFIFVHSLNILFSYGNLHPSFLFFIPLYNKYLISMP